MALTTLLRFAGRSMSIARHYVLRAMWVIPVLQVQPLSTVPGQPGYGVVTAVKLPLRYVRTVIQARLRCLLGLDLRRIIMDLMRLRQEVSGLLKAASAAVHLLSSEAGQVLRGTGLTGQPNGLPVVLHAEMELVLMARQLVTALIEPIHLAGHISLSTETVANNLDNLARKSEVVAFRTYSANSTVRMGIF